MKRNFRSHIPSKWKKTKALIKDESIAVYSPLTRLYSLPNLKQMLNQFGMLYIKPDTGSKGMNVMRIQRIKRNRHVQLHHDDQSFTFKSIKDADNYLKRFTSKRTYLIQQGIRMLRNQNRPFDFRVMVQKNSDHDWELSGICGRLAMPNRVVTNGSQGATIHTFRELMLPHLKRRQVKVYRRELVDLGMAIAYQMEDNFPDVWEVGIDIGIDQQLAPWIFEVNTRPEYIPFTKLKNLSMYRRMKRNARYAMSLGYKRYNVP
ncbi:YheC/YheD family protein [Paenibacillus sp. N1-5-1-14]|uniref:YheC/YheD family protein n=1 Tax=Paenibacillus radicibacter TaxID=2972488 RepID=UPI00215914A1|nr:YheC/YheD family protein [Paenibacillus radicibacter]MCR8642096.1 YheC/YheD family protein [Paenibacillus radicibacter]